MGLAGHGIERGAALAAPRVRADVHDVLLVGARESLHLSVMAERGSAQVAVDLQVRQCTARRTDWRNNGARGGVRTERRRSRTYPAVGYTTSPVLKTGWGTGPMPLHG